MAIETLEQYRDHFLALPISALRVIEFRDFGTLHATVVHREPPYQVEWVVWSAGKSVPAHVHPHIDIYEYHISGDIRFVLGTSAEDTENKLKSARLIRERLAKGKAFHIRPGEWHAGTAGDKDVSFWSIQKWTDGVPLTAAGVDWEGPTFSDKQKKHVVEQFNLPYAQDIQDTSGSVRAVSEECGRPVRLPIKSS